MSPKILRSSRQENKAAERFTTTAEASSARRGGSIKSVTRSFPSMFQMLFIIYLVLNVTL